MEVGAGRETLNAAQGLNSMKSTRSFPGRLWLFFIFIPVAVMVGWLVFMAGILFNMDGY
jgi:hypothetical protein